MKSNPQNKSLKQTFSLQGEVTTLRGKIWTSDLISKWCVLNNKELSRMPNFTLGRADGGACFFCVFMDASPVCTFVSFPFKSACVRLSVHFVTVPLLFLCFFTPRRLHSRSRLFIRKKIKKKNVSSVWWHSAALSVAVETRLTRGRAVVERTDWVGVWSGSKRPVKIYVFHLIPWEHGK